MDCTGWNHKRVRRVYRELGLHIRVKPKKRLPSRDAQPLEAPVQVNVSWSLDFMSDSLATQSRTVQGDCTGWVRGHGNGRAIRTLNITPAQYIRYWVDDFNREALWIEIDTSLPAARVVRILNMLAQWHGYPSQLRLDNGPELIAQLLADWAAEHAVTLAHIQPGKPAQNAFIERFNRTYRRVTCALHVAKRCWMRICLIRWPKPKRSPKIGWKNTMPFGRTKPWAMYRPTNIDSKMPEIFHFQLVLK